MRPNTGYSTLYWITKDRMKRKKVDAESIEPEILSEPEVIPEGTADLNLVEDIVTEESADIQEDDIEESINIKIQVEENPKIERFDIVKIED